MPGRRPLAGSGSDPGWTDPVSGAGTGTASLQSALSRAPQARRAGRSRPCRQAPVPRHHLQQPRSASCACARTRKQMRVDAIAASSTTPPANATGYRAVAADPPVFNLTEPGRQHHPPQPRAMTSCSNCHGIRVRKERSRQFPSPPSPRTLPTPGSHIQLRLQFTSAVKRPVV